MQGLSLKHSLGFIPAPFRTVTTLDFAGFPHIPESTLVGSRPGYRRFVVAPSLALIFQVPNLARAVRESHLIRLPCWFPSLGASPKNTSRRATLLPKLRLPRLPRFHSREIPKPVSYSVLEVTAFYYHSTALCSVHTAS